MTTLKTYVAVILDRSGSMCSIKDEARNNFNEQLQVLKEESNKPSNVAKKLLQGQPTSGLETKLTFVTFNEKIDTAIFNEDVNDVEELGVDDYRPDGMTALYDAIGFTIEKFMKDIPDIHDPDVAVLFTIITDGWENSSSDYAGEEGRKKLKSKIEDLEGTGRWTFTYLGANQDVMSTAVNDLSVSVGNTLSWRGTNAGVKSMTVAHNQALGKYYSMRRSGGTGTASFYSGSEPVKNPALVDWDETQKKLDDIDKWQAKDKEEDKS